MPEPIETPPGTSGKAKPREYHPAPLTVARIVHYVARGSADGRFPAVCRAAIVTETGPDPAVIGLCAINPSGLFFHPLDMGGIPRHSGGPSAESPTGWTECASGTRAYPPGTWHMPERTP